MFFIHRYLVSFIAIKTKELPSRYFFTILKVEGRLAETHLYLFFDSAAATNKMCYTLLLPSYRLLPSCVYWTAKTPRKDKLCNSHINHCQLNCGIRITCHLSFAMYCRDVVLLSRWSRFQSEYILRQCTHIRSIFISYDH